MSNTNLPHLVIFTADHDESDEKIVSPYIPLPKDRPSTSLVSKISPRSFALHLLTDPEDLYTLLVNIAPSMIILEHEGSITFLFLNIQ